MRAVVRVLLTLVLLIAAGLLGYDMELLSLLAMDPGRPGPRQCGYGRAGRFRLG
jgi:hypothetical protein